VFINTLNFRLKIRPNQYLGKKTLVTIRIPVKKLPVYKGFSSVFSAFLLQNARNMPHPPLSFIINFWEQAV